MVDPDSKQDSTFSLKYCKDLDGFLRQLQGNSVVQDGGDGT